jgi:hypothetical protein
MNQILEWLSDGDLRSDSLANEIAGIVIQQPQLFSDLIEGLDHPDGAVRGHTADALEKIGRAHPELLLPHLPRLISISRQDPVAMVRMHLAMIFGHLAIMKPMSLSSYPPCWICLKMRACLQSAGRLPACAYSAAGIRIDATRSFNRSPPWQSMRVWLSGRK